MKDAVNTDEASALQPIDLSGESKRVLQLVFETFGEIKGRRWLARRNRVLDGKTLEDVLHTDGERMQSRNSLTGSHMVLARDRMAD